MQVLEHMEVSAVEGSSFTPLLGPFCGVSFKRPFPLTSPNLMYWIIGHIKDFFPGYICGSLVPSSGPVLTVAIVQGLSYFSWVTWIYPENTSKLWIVSSVYSCAEGVLQKSPNYSGTYFFSPLQIPRLEFRALNLVMFMVWWALSECSQYLQSHHVQLSRECLLLHLTGVKLRESDPFKLLISLSEIIIVILDLLSQRHVYHFCQRLYIFC